MSPLIPGAKQHTNNMLFQTPQILLIVTLSSDYNTTPRLDINSSGLDEKRREEPSVFCQVRRSPDRALALRSWALALEVFSFGFGVLSFSSEVLGFSSEVVGMSVVGLLGWCLGLSFRGLVPETGGVSMLL